MEEKVLGFGGYEVIIMPAVYPCGMVSVSRLGYFSSVGYSCKHYHSSLPLYLVA